MLAAYKQVRCELLAPVLRSTNTALKSKIDHILTAAQSPSSSPRAAASGGGGQGAGHVSSQDLCAIVRSAFATTFHVAQLEQQLYLTLFHTTGKGDHSYSLLENTGVNTAGC